MIRVPAPLHGVCARGEESGPAERWAAIWDAGVAVLLDARATMDNPGAEMTLCLEFTVPPVSVPGPVRLWQGRAETRRAVALYRLPDGAFRLVHGEIDVVTMPDLGRPGETLSLRYRTCARGRGDVVDIVNHDRPQRHRARAGLAVAARLDEMLPRDERFLQVCQVAAIAGFGLPPTDLPGMSGQAVVMTTEGPRTVESLRVGQVLVTAAGARMPLRWTERRPRLCLGRMAPVQLRAPYFGLARDIWVTPETRVVRSGPAVEYNFGTEQVLVRAGDMTASTGARRDRRQALRHVHHLMLDDHACVTVDRCGIETALLADVVAAGDAKLAGKLAEVDRTPCLPVLDRAGAQALIGVKGRRVLG
ncbi:Hint domain-containing protein [Roseicyclus marinus]|uniref:Hint domain-containing protein n=1 Tax=Roseicyclus marinus TaxID=2161673 RepID=UPI00240F012E|nr:Hint domain-containing protein [Roseicyclus marinus]MDG3041195.1 Hint domain-containing protein [Roseicyclus marinus]